MFACNSLQRVVNVVASLYVCNARRHKDWPSSLHPIFIKEESETSDSKFAVQVVALTVVNSPTSFYRPF